MTDLAANVGYAVLHSIWQGLVWAGVVFLLLRTIPLRLANLRYGLVMIALAGVLLSGIGTVAYLEHQPETELSQMTTVELVEPGTVVEDGVKVEEVELSAGESAAPVKLYYVETHEEPLEWAHYVSLLSLAGTLVMLLRSARLFFITNRLEGTAALLKDTVTTQVQQKLSSVPFWRPEV